MATKLALNAGLPIQDLKGKRVLITAGPTWIKIDDVRVISNTSTGKTGILLAQSFSQAGCKVVLLLGPVQNKPIDKRIKVIDFKYFDELKETLSQELSSKKYDIVIQTAAVSDYRPKSIPAKKIKSGLNDFNLKLVPTLKIINLIKKISPLVFLIGFKYEPRSTKFELINKALELIINSQADMVVANSALKDKYQAYFVTLDKVSGVILNKKTLAKKLISLIGEKK